MKVMLILVNVVDEFKNEFCIKYNISVMNYIAAVIGCLDIQYRKQKWLQKILFSGLTFTSDSFNEKSSLDVYSDKHQMKQLF